MFLFISSFSHILLYLLELCNVDFEVFIPFEFALDRHYVFSISNFTLMGFFKVLLELIQLCPQHLPFILDVIKFPRDVGLVSETILFNYGFTFADSKIYINSFFIKNTQTR